MDEIWTLLAQILGEQESSVDWVLCRLCSLWQAALGPHDVCLVSCRDKAAGGKFLVCGAGDNPAAKHSREFMKLASSEWSETVSNKLADGFDEFQTVRFRCNDRLPVGGVLIGTDTPIGDDDLIDTLKLVSANALRAAQEHADYGDDHAETTSPAVAPPADLKPTVLDWREVALDPERLESLAEFAAGAGHEVNNPLGTIVGRVQLLLRDEQDPDRRQSLSTIGGQAYRIRDMIGDVMLFARPPATDPVWNQLSEVMEEVLDGFETDLRESEFDVDIEFDHTTRVFADAVQLRVSLGALVRNVVEAAAESGDREMQIRADSQSVGAGGGIQISVSDNGIGLNEEQRRHLFDPFYSGRQAGRGLGFGLSKCWRIVSNHGGTMDVSTDRGWTTFRMTFPDSPD